MTTKIITPESLFGSGPVVVLGPSTIPPEGTAYRATWDADHESDPVRARELHLAAIEAWRKHPVASFGGGMLVRARLSYHREKVGQE